MEEGKNNFLKNWMEWKSMNKESNWKCYLQEWHIWKEIINGRIRKEKNDLRESLNEDNIKKLFDRIIIW